MLYNRIVIFGMGAISKLLSSSVRVNTKIVGYLTSCSTYKANCDIPIYTSASQLKKIEFDYIVVAFGDAIKGITYLKKAGIPAEKIVGYAYSGLKYADNEIQQLCNGLFYDKINNSIIPKLFNLPIKKYYLCGINIAENQNIISEDFVREQTLSFLAEEINRRNILGCVAEVGVSNGHFARKINYLFPQKKMYLYDTYSGLIDEDKAHAFELGWGEEQYAEKDEMIDMEELVSNMPFKEQCIIKRGYFPYDFEFNEKFAFVDMDIDFYDTTKAGLEAIYPQVSLGGYIMIHDFNNLIFSECQQAVRDFCAKYNVAYVPIPDNGGSVIIGR